MKRMLCAVLAILLAITLTGCRREEPEPTPNPIATIIMANGSTMRFELHLDAAPNTVANFCTLANKGFYDGLEFFRVVPGVFIQAGDPNNDGTGDAGYTIKGEFSKNGVTNDLSHNRGVISMARKEGYNTASSQFFIMQGNYPEYDGSYAAFGTALDEETLATLDAIASQPVVGHYLPYQRQRIQTVRVNTHNVELEAETIPLEK